MTTTQYIGARYVPLFAEPLDWDITKTYEPLTIVYTSGNSYTSRQYVPAGVDITNTEYWALTGNYNAQIEQYRAEVAQYDERISANANAISAETTRAKAAEQTNANAISAETTRAKAAEKAKETTCIYIGNSYTDGVGADGVGFYALSKSMYDNSYKYTTSGGGFNTYTSHSVTYSDLLTNASNDTTFDNSSVTDIIFTCAIGDTNSIIETSDYSAWLDVIHNTLKKAKQLFPNATSYIHFAEMIEGRTTRDSISKDWMYQQYRVHRSFKWACTRGDIRACYLGWTGWQCNYTSGYCASDGYHPNANGYQMMYSSFVNALKGKYPYYERNASLPILGNSSYNIKIRAFSPDEYYFYIPRFPKTIMSDIAAGGYVDLAYLQDASTSTGFCMMLPETTMPIMTSSGDAFTTVYTNRVASTGALSIRLAAIKAITVSDLPNNVMLIGASGQCNNIVSI